METSGDVIQLFRHLSPSDLGELGLVAAGALFLGLLNQRIMPAIARKVPNRYRFHLLGLTPVIRLAIIVAALIWMVPLLIEPTFENLIALMGALGLALGFALKDYVSSLIAGIVTLFEMPYRPGDWITIGDAYGRVRAIHMRTVELVTLDDTVVIIPHLRIWQDTIGNANDGGPNLQCATDFYVQPKHQPSQIVSALHDVALTSPLVRLEQPTDVRVWSQPWGTHYRLRAYPLDPRQQGAFVSDLTVRGHDTLRRLGVELVTAPAVTKVPR